LPAKRRDALLVPDSSIPTDVSTPVTPTTPGGFRLPKWSELAYAIKASGMKDRLIFTFLALAVYRFAVQVPVWGINAEALKSLAANSQLLGMLDMFSGGALASLSVMALGIGPYITASIIMQLMTAVIPKLEELQKDGGESGRRQISQITRYVSVGIALLQSFAVTRLFTLNPQVLLPGVEPMFFFPAAMLALVAGSMFSLWLSELITERGVGNGSSILIFVGIISSLPFYIGQTAELVQADGSRWLGLGILVGIYVLTLALIILLQEAFYRVYIVQARRQVGRKTFGGGNSFIPFKLNPSGVMPLIFTFMLLSFPGLLVDMLLQTKPTGILFEALRMYKTYMTPGSPLYIAVQFGLILFFSYFYVTLVPSLQPKEIAENLRKHGNAIPGIKPGKATGVYLDTLISHLTFIGAMMLGVITLIASSATALTGISTLAGLGTTALIIMVGVALDTVNQIRVQLLAKQYEGFLK
jgi:preprotein translocase subunit SecY